MNAVDTNVLVRYQVADFDLSMARLDGVSLLDAADS